jgi:hypothetical protein
VLVVDVGRWRDHRLDVRPRQDHTTAREARMSDRERTYSWEDPTGLAGPVRSDSGTLRAEGRLLRAGRRVALAEGELTDADGTLYAHATANCMILEP